ARQPVEKGRGPHLPGNPRRQGLAPHEVLADAGWQIAVAGEARMLCILPGKHGGDTGIDQSIERVTAVSLLPVVPIVPPRLALAGMTMVRRAVMGRPLAFRRARMNGRYT